jgi:hypothetical protein
MEDFRRYLESAAPFVIVLAFSSIVTIFSSFYKNDTQTFVQCSIFSLGLALSVKYLVENSSSETINALNILASLKDETKLALSFATVSIIYFGSSFYITSNASNTSRADANSTPASCDVVVQFEVPETLPEDDTKLFEYTFEKYINLFEFLISNHVKS